MITFSATGAPPLRKRYVADIRGATVASHGGPVVESLPSRCLSVGSTRSRKL